VRVCVCALGCVCGGGGYFSVVDLATPDSVVTQLLHVARGVLQWTRCVAVCVGCVAACAVCCVAVWLFQQTKTLRHSYYMLHGVCCSVWGVLQCVWCVAVCCNTV